VAEVRPGLARWMADHVARMHRVPFRAGPRFNSQVAFLWDEKCGAGCSPSGPACEWRTARHTPRRARTRTRTRTATRRASGQAQGPSGARICTAPKPPAPTTHLSQISSHWLRLAISTSDYGEQGRGRARCRPLAGLTIESMHRPPRALPLGVRRSVSLGCGGSESPTAGGAEGGLH
jgi:hypothetical protein